MPSGREKLIQRAKNAARKSKFLDFKREFDLASAGAWCEVIKDIVAFANSGGGIIVFGVADDGSPSNFEATELLRYDTANITTQIARYTGHQFADIEIVEINRVGRVFAALVIGPAEVPLIFTKPGTYEVAFEGAGKKQKNAFGLGTIYFRHNSKSETGNRDDLLSWRDGEIEKHRKAWLGGIRKVVASGADEMITVISSKSSKPTDGSVISATVTNDPSAVRFFPKNAEDIWPLRQKDLIREVNQRLSGGFKMGSYDVTCIKTKFDLLGAHPEFACKPHKLASPQYSQSLVDWIVDQHEKDNSFFQRAREEYKQKA